LLIAVIFMSVMLSFGLALSSLGYKQQVLASSAIESQYAFYAADTALECALYADQQQDLFAYRKYDGKAKTMLCDGTAVSVIENPPSVTVLVSTAQLSLDGGTRCADIAVYKYTSGQSPGGYTTFLFSTGYDTSCSTLANPDTARFVSRGMSAHY